MADVLSSRYPRQIYVAHLDPMRMGPTAREATYKYLFWQAQASGKLSKVDARSEEAGKAFFLTDVNPMERMTEPALRGYFDYRSHASDLWNYIGYNYVFTVFNFLKYPPERFFEARKNSEDLMSDLRPIPERFTFREQSMHIIRWFFQSRVEKDSNGEFLIKRAVSDVFIRDARLAFPDPFKATTLILLAYNAPYFSNQLSKDEHAAYEFAFSQGKSWLQKAGYHSVVIGPGLTDEDFADRVHLAASGGQ